jgi:hypothetical protein
MPVCPSGHDSAATDFCDVCGRQLGAPAAPSAVAVEPATVCPSCGEANSGRFCEGCGYDLVAGGAGWSAVVSADRAYFDTVSSTDEDITFPAAYPERVVRLRAGEVRIGRRSRSRGLVPEIDLTGPPEDPGISHLHAVLRTLPDGGWTLTDAGSTNGTTINDDPAVLGADAAVAIDDGDRIHVGAWTTITLRADGSR